jgi:selenocysteine lyase/cysteine desulfurase
MDSNIGGAIANPAVYDIPRKDGAYAAYRAGGLRIAPHPFNTVSDIDRTFAILNATGAA